MELSQLQCPLCQLHFHALQWQDGICPGCDNPYWWRKNPDPEESEPVVRWETYK